MCMLQQFLAAPKKKRQVILFLDLIRVNYMPSLLFLQQNAILGVGPFLEDKVVLILLIVKVKTLSS